MNKLHSLLYLYNDGYNPFPHLTGGMLNNELYSYYNNLITQIENNNMSNYWILPDNSLIKGITKQRMKTFIKTKPELFNKQIVDVTLLDTIKPNKLQKASNDTEIFTIKIYVYNINNEGEFDYNDIDTWTLTINYTKEELDNNKRTFEKFVENINKMVKLAKAKKITTDFTGITYNQFLELYNNLKNRIGKGLIHYNTGLGYKPYNGIHGGTLKNKAERKKADEIITQIKSGTLPNENDLMFLDKNWSHTKLGNLMKQYFPGENNNMNDNMNDKINELYKLDDEISNKIENLLTIDEQPIEIQREILYNFLPKENNETKENYIKRLLESTEDLISEENLNEIFNDKAGIEFMNEITDFENITIDAKLQPHITTLNNEIEYLENEKNAITEERNKLIKNKASTKTINELNEHLKELNKQINIYNSQKYTLQENEGKFLPGGIRAEKYEITQPDYYLPIQEYMNDKENNIRSNEELIKNILVPNEEVEYEWLKIAYETNKNALGWNTTKENKDKITKEKSEFLTMLNMLPNVTAKNILLRNENKKIGEQLQNKNIQEYLYPWETIPIDNSTNNVEYEVKNFTKQKTGGYKGETIKTNVIEYINNKQKNGLTPEEIERQAEIDGIKIPTIPITKSKLTGKISNTNNDTKQRMFYKRNANGIIQPDKLIINGLIPNDDNKLVNGTKEINISNGKYKRLVYDILTNNARVFYLPLEDSNAILTNDGRVNLNYTTSKHEGAGESYNVPITRMHIIPAKTIIKNAEKILNDIEKVNRKVIYLNKN